MFSVSAVFALAGTSVLGARCAAVVYVPERSVGSAPRTGFWTVSRGLIRRVCRPGTTDVLFWAPGQLFGKDERSVISPVTGSTIVNHVSRGCLLWDQVAPHIPFFLQPDLFQLHSQIWNSCIQFVTCGTQKI